MSPYTIKHWTEKGFSEEDAKYQISIRRIYNKNYWIHRFGDVEGMQKYHEFITKGTKGKKHSLERKKNNKRCREYWEHRGYSGSEIDEKMSKIQRTFTLKSCVKKFGTVEGTKRFLSRQEKWQKSLQNKTKKELYYINLKKDSQSIEFFIKKYGEEWIKEFLDKKVGNGEVGNLIREIILKFKTRDAFISEFKNLSPKFMVLRKILASKIIQKVFNIHQDEINDVFLEILKTYGVKKWNPEQYGMSILYRQIYYKSAGEVEIAKFLYEKNIKFKYNKKYPNQTRYYYDFYLIDHDCYIEYTGMSGKSFYDKRIKNKREMCLKLGFKCYMSKNIPDIKNKILDILK